MNRLRLCHALRCLCLGLSFLLVNPASSAPGAHGPGGEHLDTQGDAVTGEAVPRLEASSELFELVGRLHGGELSLLIDRYETNEPVLGAAVEVESGPLKARAKFHADHGDYAIDDPAFLQVLAEPGEHALVFTILASEDSDLLEGTLVNAAPAGSEAHGHSHEGEHGHAHGLGRAGWAAGGVLALAALGAVAWRSQRKGAAARGATR